MKRFLIFTLTFLSLINLSCNKDDDSGDANPQAGEAQFEATINGGTYSNYSFEIGVYEAVKGTNGNTLNIGAGDPNGEMITLFLNGTGGFGSGTVKEMGDIDSDNFVTYALIRQQGTELSYFSSTGSVNITNSREHPTKSGHRLISGNFDVTASTIDGDNTTSITGSFTELDYQE